MNVLVSRCAIIDPGLQPTPSAGNNSTVLMARFITSMMMHIIVEKDLAHSLNMMKYLVNHHQHFVNPYASFLFGFLSFIISLHVEINALVIFASMTNVTGIVVKYVAIAAIINIPRFYVLCISDNIGLDCINVQLKVINFRKDNKLKDAPCGIRCLRLV